MMDRTVTIVVDGLTIIGPNICDHCGTVQRALEPTEDYGNCQCLCHATKKLERIRAAMPQKKG